MNIYIFLCSLFSVLVVTGNLVYQKFVQLKIFSFLIFELSAGAIFYPLTFLITNLITEFYGKEKASFCVRLGIIMNVLVALIIVFLNYLPSTDWSKIDNNIFNMMFGVYSVALIGSILANYIAQMVDINLYLFIRKLTNNKYLFLRYLSMAISLFIDTSIVIIFITIFKIAPFQQMLPLIISSYSFKLFFSVTTLPIFYLAVYILKYFRLVNDK